MVRDWPGIAVAGNRVGVLDIDRYVMKVLPLRARRAISG
jgi:hypothetical protein